MSGLRVRLSPHPPPTYLGVGVGLGRFFVSVLVLHLSACGGSGGSTPTFTGQVWLQVWVLVAARMSGCLCPLAAEHKCDSVCG